jgi:hypothetical protein
MHINKSNIIGLPIMRYMIYMLIITMTISSVSLSRYASSLARDDSAGVAKFDVSVTHDYWGSDEYSHISLVQTIGETTDYIFTVTNDSDVAVRARLVILSATSAYTVDPTVEIPAYDSRDVSVTIQGLFTGNDVQMYVEYEQID